VVASLLDSPEGLQLGGEKRKVTIVMSDLRGFTSLSERLPPERVVTMVNRYLGTMVEVIMQYQGTINEFIGDAIFVIFGAPIWRQDDAQRAVACAVAMQVAMASVNAQNRQEGLPDVEMGIGVNTGEVVVGNIGSPKRTKYGVVGSHVNLTSRIQSYTIGSQIFISESTLNEAGPTLTIRDEIQVEAKGFETPIVLYDLLGIGGEYDLFLPEPEEEVSFVPSEEIPPRYSVLEGTDVGRTVFEGSFVKLSAKGGEIRAPDPVMPLSNLRIQLTGLNGEEISRYLYAKVVGSPTDSRASFAVRFISIPPAIAAFFRGLAGSRPQAFDP
jgi:adenylate cyclase